MKVGTVYAPELQSVRELEASLPKRTPRGLVITESGVIIGGAYLGEKAKPGPIIIDAQKAINDAQACMDDFSGHPRDIRGWIITACGALLALCFYVISRGA